MEVEAGDPDLSNSARQVPATAPGLRAYRVRAAYGENLGIGARWSYAEDPCRTDRTETRIRWPGTPQGRRQVSRG
jgi:hypothetical protein